MRKQWKLLSYSPPLRTLSMYRRCSKLFSRRYRTCYIYFYYPNIKVFRWQGVWFEVHSGWNRGGGRAVVNILVMCVFSWKTTFSKPVYTIFSIRGNIHIMLSHFPTFWRALVDICRGGKHFGGLCLQYWDNFYFNAVRNRKASYIFWTDGRSNSVCMQSRLSLSISSYPTLSYLSSEHPRPAGPASGGGLGWIKVDPLALIPSLIGSFMIYIQQ